MPSLEVEIQSFLARFSLHLRCIAGHPAISGPALMELLGYGILNEDFPSTVEAADNILGR
jgi:hypothetical protein